MNKMENMRITTKQYSVYGKLFSYEEITKNEFEKGIKHFMKDWGKLLDQLTKSTGGSSNG